MASTTSRHRLRRTVAAALGVAAAVAVTLGLPSTAHAASATVVSLTFDDGNQDQYDTARPILIAHQMVATFYINSSRVNTSGYLTQAQIAQLAADGNEIAGHTVDHADLPTLPIDDQKREVCNDRVALLNMGFQVKNLAYPYGDANATTQQVAADCGYNSARTVGGVVSPGSCNGCPVAESIPPANAYYTQTPDSVKTSTTLANLQTYVTQAERGGGGWVELVIHHVCNGCGDDYAVSPATLTAFLDWLAPRSAQGTRVGTVDSIIGGSLKPGVPGPPLPPPAGGNVVQNPSLESAGSTGVPTCFQLGGYGTNRYALTRNTHAHPGSSSEQVAVSSYTSGDRKLVTKQDSSSCATPVTAGHTYHVRAWYKGSWVPAMQVKVTLYYRDTSGTWIYWTSGPALAAVSAW